MIIELWTFTVGAETEKNVVLETQEALTAKIEEINSVTPSSGTFNFTLCHYCLYDPQKYENVHIEQKRRKTW